jgi:hypothetical protein
MSDAPVILPFVIWPGASPAQLTRLLEFWANVIVQASWRAARAAARAERRPKRPRPLHQSGTSGSDRHPT